MKAIKSLSFNPWFNGLMDKDAYWRDNQAQ